MVVQLTAVTIKTTAMTADNKLNRFMACFFFYCSILYPKIDKETLYETG